MEKNNKYFADMKLKFNKKLRTNITRNLVNLLIVNQNIRNYKIMGKKRMKIENI